MRKLLIGMMAVGVAVSSLAGPAFAQYGMDKSPPKNTLTPDLPRLRPTARAGRHPGTAEPLVGGHGPFQSGVPA